MSMTAYVMFTLGTPSPNCAELWISPCTLTDASQSGLELELRGSELHSGLCAGCLEEMDFGPVKPVSSSSSRKW